MSAISLKSITGITSITTPAGVDNVFTVHTNDTTERFRVDQTGNLNIAGIVTVTKDLDVDGHTNLDNVSVAGVSTFTGRGTFDEKVLIGTNTAGHSSDLTIGNAASGTGGRIMIRSASNAGGYISFQDTTGSSVDGSIEYNHILNSYNFYFGSQERFRIHTQGMLGLSGANYGTSGQVLTSGGSGSAVSWTTIPTQVTINNNAANRIITGEGGTTLNGEANLTFDGTTLTNTGTGSRNNTIYTSTNNSVFLTLQNSQRRFNINNVTGGAFTIYDSTASAERLRINSSGNVSINNDLDVDGHTNLDNVSVAGITTFAQAAGAVTVPAGGDIRIANSGGWTGEYGGKIQHYSNFLYIQGGTNGIRLRHSDGNDRWVIGSSGHFDPGTGGTYDIGNNGNRVRDIYANDFRAPDGNGNGLYAGNSLDLHLFHNGADSYIENDTGNLNFTNKNNGNIIFRTTSSETERLRIDSSGQLSIGAVPSSGAGLLNIRPGSSDDTYLKFRRAADFDGTFDGTAIDSRNSANNANRDLIVRFAKCAIWAGGSEKYRIASAGQFGIGGANYGTAGQVLTSTGSSSGLSWTTPSGKVVNYDSTIVTAAGSASLSQGSYSNNIIGLSYAAASSSNKLLLIASVSVGYQHGQSVASRFTVSGGAITGATGDASGNRRRATTAAWINSGYQVTNMTLVYEHSSPSTSSVTYGVQLGQSDNGTQTVYWNRSWADENQNYRIRAVTTLTIIELEG